jgi:predicted dehydrogenase
LGGLIEARAALISSNGPIFGHEGWLGRRDRSGDWMIEQAVHAWDVLHWIAGEPPASAVGTGRTGLFSARDPDRDVTDWYQVQLSWPSRFQASLTHSWIDPADASFTGNSLRVVGESGGFDFGTGTATFRDRSKPRQNLHPGNIGDTGLAIASFLDAIRAERPAHPPIALQEAREAVITGLMVRRAVDAGRTVTRDEVGMDSV